MLDVGVGCCPRRLLTSLFTTAPKTATPTALPTERANMFAPVATPRLDHETAVCAATTPGLATYPKPMPITKHANARW